MDVSVTDSHGVPIADLKPEQFSITENGRPRKISRFEFGTVNVSFSLIVDYSRSMRTRRVALMRGMKAFSDQLRPEDDVEVLLFNDRVQRLLPFAPPNLQKWNTALYGETMDGRTALYDAVVTSSAGLGESKHERRVMIVLSDGDDSASKAKLDDAVEQLRSTNGLLYGIGLFTAGEPQTNAGALKRLAETTGGLALFDPDGTKLPETLAAIIHDLRTRYWVGFYSEDPPAGKAEVRRLSVKVDDPRKLEIHARRTYRIGAAR